MSTSETKLKQITVFLFYCGFYFPCKHPLKLCMLQNADNDCSDDDDASDDDIDDTMVSLTTLWSVWQHYGQLKLIDDWPHCSFWRHYGKIDDAQVDLS